MRASRPLTEGEIPHARHGVDGFEQAQPIDAEEADEGRRRIVARQRFLERGESVELAG